MSDKDYKREARKVEIEFTLNENDEVICNRYITVNGGKLPVVTSIGNDAKQFLCEALGVSSINTEGWQDIEMQNMKDVQAFTQHYFDSMSEIFSNKNEKDSMQYAFILHTAPSGATLPLPNEYDMLNDCLAHVLNAPDADYFHALLNSAEGLADEAFAAHQEGEVDYAWALMQVANDCIINMWNNTTVPQMIQAVINNDGANG